MNIILVSHPSRCHHVAKLQSRLPIIATVVDTVSAWSGHNAAIRIASALDERVVIMEDDAVPVVDFTQRATAWCDRHPDDLLSFYLGTGRPREYQGLIDERVRIADLQGRDEMQLPSLLLHAVCYSIPQAGLPGIIEKMGQRKEADFAIGRAWGKSVWYPIESLVQHRDESTVERHPDGLQRGNESRVARRLAGPLMF